MNEPIKIGWVCRDGYLDLFPLIEEVLRSKKHIRSSFVTHMTTDAQYLERKYGYIDIAVVEESVERYKSSKMSKSSQVDLLNKYDAVPIVRALWSTSQEMSMSQNELLSLAVAHIRFWEEYISSTDIDLLIYERPSILSSCTAWIVCQKHNIRCVDYVDTVMDTMTVVDNFHGDYAEALNYAIQRIETGSDPISNRAKDYLGKMTQDPKKTNEALLYSRITDHRARLKISRMKGLYELIRFHRTHKGYYLYAGSLYKKIWKNVVYTMRYYFHKYIDIFSTIDDLSSGKYYVYPLFMKGEWSNHIFMSPGYWDPLGTLKHLSICMPPGHTLCVKEHYSGYGSRSIVDLLRIKSITGVKIVSPFEDSFELIKKSAGVITLGSTMGFEAMLLSKPVILLGEPWYRDIPGIFCASKLEEIASFLSSSNRLKLPNTHQKLAIIQALLDISGEGIKLPREGTLDPTNVESMSNILVRYIDDMGSIPRAV